MPSKSKAQRDFMSAASHSKRFAKKAGIKRSVAEEFHKADKAKAERRRKRRHKRGHNR